jgi:hypothetical protein
VKDVKDHKAQQRAAQIAGSEREPARVTMRLFSYTVRYDHGSAPNPFWGVCTLTICKPVIRRVAAELDWVVGLRGDSVLYAMRVTDRKTLAKYDEYCREHLPNKIPQWSSRDFRRRVGDCIYDYSVTNPPRLRESVHTKENRETDLGGINALFSEDFYYFGCEPVPLPAGLTPIVHRRGHKSDANDPYISTFIRWIRRQRYAHNIAAAEPELKDELTEPDCRSKCSKRDRRESEEDEQQASNTKRGLTKRRS